MSSVKEKVQIMVNDLPHDCTIEDIQYHIYVIAKIQNGIHDLENYKMLSHKEAKNKMQKWLS